MKKSIAVLAVLVLVPLLSQAQVSPVGVIANIDFSFYFGGKLLPAGAYEFKPVAVSQDNVMRATSLKTRESFLAPIVTTISRSHQAQTEVVFDKAGSEFYLTEVFMAGEDGFLLKGAAGQHTHVSVKGK